MLSSGWRGVPIVAVVHVLLEQAVSGSSSVSMKFARALETQHDDRRSSGLLLREKLPWRTWKHSNQETRMSSKTIYEGADSGGSVSI